MNFYLTASVLLITCLSCAAQIGGDFKLPKTWAKDFTITLSYHGSMSGGSTDIRFTYDSCIYSSSSNRGPSKDGNFLLTEKDRMAILAKLQEYKVDKIRSQTGVHVVSDGWSQSMCFGFHCVSGGTSDEMSEKDKNYFLDAYRYLEEFAMKGAKIKY